MPQERCARLKELFAVGAPEHGSDAFGQLLQRMRDAVIGAASILQYDSAVLAARQLGVGVPPEPFTERQQHVSPPSPPSPVRWGGSGWGPSGKAGDGAPILHTRLLRGMFPFF